MRPRAWAAIATMVLALLLFALIGPCDTNDKTAPAPPAAGDAREDPAPPPVIPNEKIEMPPESVGTERVYRKGRIHRPEEDVEIPWDVLITGPGVAHSLEVAEEEGLETVGGILRPVRLTDGFLPPAWQVTRTSAAGRFEVTWGPRIQGRVDLLFATRDGEGKIRIRHRLTGANAGLPDRILVPKPGSIGGRILTETGEPVEKALVYCLPLDILLPGEMKGLSRRASPFTGLFLVDWARHARTGKDGRFRIDDLRPAPYRVFARRRDRGGEIRRIDVHSGPPPVDRDIVLDIEGAYVRGLIADERTGDPIKGCFVATDDPQGTAKSGHDGTYRIGPMAPGEFRSFILRRHYEMARIGPFELVEGRTFVAPTTYLISSK